MKRILVFSFFFGILSTSLVSQSFTTVRSGNPAPTTCNGGPGKQAPKTKRGFSSWKIVNPGSDALVYGAKSGVPYSGDSCLSKLTYTIKDAIGFKHTFSVSISNGQ